VQRAVTAERGNSAIGFENEQNIEAYLSTATVIQPVLHVTAGGHPGKSSFRLAGGVNVIAKPSDTLPNGLQVVTNEAAAWQIAKHLGWTGLVGATVLRPVDSWSTGTTTSSPQCK